MKLATWMLLLSFLGLLASCQVKETEGGEGLISGHTPVSNAFTLLTPTSDILVTGDTLSLSLRFPFEVTVSGAPSLSVVIGSTTRNAVYVSGSGTKTITFRYTIVAGDNDSNGITVTGISLNGGSLTFDNNGTVTNCSTTLSSQTFSGLLVDNTAPSITGFTQSNLAGYYRLGDTLSFVMSFSEKVYVTGSPRIQVTFTAGGTVNATYAGGSGTTSLSFTYTITNADSDFDGYVFTSPINLNSGTIKDAAGNNSSLDFSAFTAAAQTTSSTRDFDGRLPFVTSVTPPANGTYLAAQNLDVTVLFDRAVNVTGSPYIVLTIGSNSRQAVYFSGTGTNTIVFRYTTIPGDVDSDGIVIANTITQNGGTITGAAAPTNNFFGNVPNNTLNSPSTPGVLAGAIQPQATSVTRNVDSTSAIWGTANDNIWIIGQTLLITVGFNTGIFVNQTSGTPRIPITIGATTKYATYLSGGDGQTNIVFTYTIVEGDLDTDGSIDLGDIEPNGGTMVDSSNTNASVTLPVTSLTTTRIDGVRPTISSVTAPADGTYSTVTGVNHLNFLFTVTWSEAVNYSSTAAAAAYIPLTIGATAVNAIYAAGNNTTTFTHRPSTLATYNDLDGITVSSPFAGTGTFRDQAGNSATDLTFAPPVTTGVLVDTTAPTVSSISAQPADATYVQSDDLDFDVTFSEPVTTNVSGGYPRIALTIGATTRYLVPTASTTATVHTFRYTIVNNEVDANGVAMGTSVESNGTGYARDGGLNNVGGTFVAPNTTGILVDAQVPSVSSATTTAGTYVSGGDGTNTITLTINMSESVTVDEGGGTPTVTLDVATGNVSATYNSGTSTATALKFDYTVDGSADMDLDGLALGAASIQLNGGTIQDAAGNNATLTIGAVTNLSTVYIAPHCEVWLKGSTTNRSGFSVKPTINTTAALSAGYYQFDGATDTLGFSSLSSVYALYMAIRTPDGVDTFPQDLVDGAVTLDNNTIDVTTTDSPDFQVSTSYSGTGNTHLAAFNTNATSQLELIYGAGAALPSAPLIPSTFSGDVAEVLIFSAALSAGQQTEVYNYINSAYP